MLYGACYYPEQWPEERWPIDAAMMREAHFNVVRMAEFAWARMEPEDGAFDFAWLDRAIALMEENGIAVILGTPTAGPPKWLMDKHPDMYQRDMFGRKRGFGARRHYCFNNETFRRYAARIVERMASHYAGSDRIVGWQIDNEMGMIDTARCYCDSCLVAFKDWLRRKYGTIDAVNKAWGTVFSSQTYRNWDEVHLPTYAVHQHHNPGFALDFYRFSSDSVISFQRMQEELLRKHAPGHTVTTNLMGKYNHVDGYEQVKGLDIVSTGIYPNLKSTRVDRPAYAAAAHDLTRSLKKSNFWILEHQSGAPGAVTTGPTPVPGEMRRWTLQSVAHGADAIVYFRWRTLNVSIEEYWHGILQHHGAPGPRYEEAKQIGAELKRLAPLLARTTPKPRVAIVRCHDNEWAFEFQPHAKNYEYMRHLETYYRYFFDRSIAVDIVSPEADLADYALVVAPNLMMATEESVERLYGFVRRGGRLAMDFRAGAKELDNSISLKKLPGAFRELLGIEIETYGVLEEDLPNRLRFVEDGRVTAANVWFDAVEPIEAEPIVVYADRYLAGVPAATRRAYGEGAAYYIGTEPDAAGLAILMDRICREAGVEPTLPDLPSGVEAAARVGDDGGEIVFVLNHADDAKKLPLPAAYEDLLTDATVQGVVELAPQQAMALRRLG
ncbi:beta-galactosidase [Paenibacillus sp.]|uniref:beta-galactosidase n=1 Tax=Paenibacillus sp. TaxID=58172 RepID=UPI002D61AABB|nr:beta-galactosidase [Paenibacillus sp.]HZG55399.1 beta-galactosidase [Paenibacillus sp.]